MQFLYAENKKIRKFTFRTVLKSEWLKALTHANGEDGFFLMGVFCSKDEVLSEYEFLPSSSAIIQTASSAQIDLLSVSQG
jgi:hypothetical protein